MLIACGDDLQMIDSSSIRVCQHRTDAKKSPQANGEKDLLPDARSARRSRLTIRIHALVDANGLVVGRKLKPGQAHEGRNTADMPDGLADGQILVADRAHDFNAPSNAMDQRGAWACIKPVSNRKQLPAFSPFL